MAAGCRWFPHAAPRQRRCFARTPNGASPPVPSFARPWYVAGLALVVGLAIDTVALHQPPGFGLMFGMWVALAVAASVSWLIGEPRPAGFAHWTITDYLSHPFMTVGEMAGGSREFLAVGLRGSFGDQHRKHGLLADSWAARRVRDAQQELDLWSVDDVVCTKPAAASR